MTFDQAVERIVKAKRRPVADLFGGDPVSARTAYRRLAQAVHPDRVPEVRRLQAEAAMADLGVLWASYTGGGASDGHFTVSTRKRAYAATGALYKGQIATLYPCTWMEGDDERQGLMKMPRSPRDSDLMQAEATALKTLGAAEEKYRPFVPTLVESFRHRDKVSRIERRVNVTARLDGFYSLGEVALAYPHGVAHQDAAWMFRRLLTVLGFAHENGIVHGAVIPAHVLIHPAKHGLVLTDWCYSVETKTALRAWDENMVLFYPPEVEAKEPATQATDIFMAAKTLRALVGPKSGSALRAFVRGCTLERESMRPHDAWDLLGEYDELLYRLYGPRKYRPFKMAAV